MIKQFETYIEAHNLCKKSDSILIATSGGADSVTLLHLFVNTGYKVALAHCNFSLRGNESDTDESFVKKLGNKYLLKTHVKRFETVTFAKENKLSIEMAARELRYKWFNELVSEYNYNWIATGHHLNDSIETLLLNLTRGVGLNGLTGIPKKNYNVIRPLLFATRELIEKYIQQENLTYRIDSSNESDKYMRNIIRTQVIPSLKKINPAFEGTMGKNIKNFQESYEIFRLSVNEIKKELVHYKKNKVKVNINKLLTTNNNETVLFEIIKDYGFNNSQIPKIIQSCIGNPGKVFYSQNHKLLIDRELIIIEPFQKELQAHTINSLEELNTLSFNLKSELIQIEDFILDKNIEIANLDFDKITFPITIRKWNSGDYFIPLGMDKKKKLSDFFIDNKIDRFKKENTRVFESNNNIFWIGGLRIDNRFKITDTTTTILKLTLIT